MVRIEDFHIQFDEKWAVYHPGDQVTGSVHLRLNDKVFVDSIVAHFYGQARVMWITRETKDGAYRAIPYSSETVYFNEKTELWHYSSAAEREKAKVSEVPQCVTRLFPRTFKALFCTPPIVLWADC